MREPEAGRTAPAQTPGPWHVEGLSRRGTSPPSISVHAVRDRDNIAQRVAWVVTPRDTPEVAEANGALMAAAPDLLAALEACLPWIKRMHHLLDKSDVYNFDNEYDNADIAPCLAALERARAAIARVVPNG